MHSRFYLATLPLAVGIVGPGAIGSTFMRQLQQQKQVGILAAFHVPSWLPFIHCLGCPSFASSVIIMMNHSACPLKARQCAPHLQQSWLPFFCLISDSACPLKARSWAPHLQQKLCHGVLGFCCWASFHALCLVGISGIPQAPHPASCRPMPGHAYKTEGVKICPTS